MSHGQQQPCKQYLVPAVTAFSELRTHMILTRTPKKQKKIGHHARRGRASATAPLRTGVDTRCTPLEVPPALVALSLIIARDGHGAGYFACELCPVMQ